MVFKRSDFSGKAFDSPIEEIKNTLIDKFLLFGTFAGFLVFIISSFPLSNLEVNFDFYSDLIALFSLLAVYLFRNRIYVYLKTILVIGFVFMLFLSDLIDNGVGSTDQVLIVFIPFLSVLVFRIRTTIAIFIGVLIAYAIVGYCFLNGILISETLNPAWNTIPSWINSITTITLVATVLSVFVYIYNTKSESFISDLEHRNEELFYRDQLLETSLQEKEIMIQEIHHRVKNNLAVVSGLLELQSFQIDNSELRYILSKSTNRIMSIAKVHEMLYESSDYSNIPFNSYIEELAKIVTRSINKEDKVINFDFDIEIESMNLNLGVPLGIIFNELITNSIKYGFVNSEDNLISISVKEQGKNVVVNYQDNGIGITDINSATKESLGFQLIHSLFDQIEANYSYETIGKFELTFFFPANNNSGPYQKHSVSIN